MRRLILLAGAFAATASTPAMSASTDGKNRHVHVDNSSSQTVNNLYASPVTAKTWEEDLLGQRSLLAATSVDANIDNGTSECNYDLKAVFADGRTLEHRNVNVCTASKWVLSDSGESIQ